MEARSSWSGFNSHLNLRASSAIVQSHGSRDRNFDLVIQPASLLFHCSRQTKRSEMTSRVPSRFHPSIMLPRLGAAPHRQPGSTMDCETSSAVLRSQPRLRRAWYMVTHLSPLLLLSFPHLLPSISLRFCLLTHLLPFHLVVLNTRWYDTLYLFTLIQKTSLRLVLHSPQQQHHTEPRPVAEKVFTPY